MLRASSILCLPAALALATAVPAADLPAIVNGTQVVQGKTQPATPPAADKSRLPVIINYPSAALQAPTDQKSDAKLPVIIGNPPAPQAANPAPARMAVAYTLTAYNEYMGSVAYNPYRLGTMASYDYGMGYGFSAPYGGYYTGGYGYGGYGYGLGYGFPTYDTFGPWGYGLYPPRVEVLDSGVRPNVGRLTSMPSVASPVYGHVMGVYYR